ncbi:MAG: type II toxin-antitoxin system RelE/ParE family toxin [Planctomycetaceae bacterium]|nr:type II toxin-antitoxin system RelE/ParE family toxin [Planctomycetaceae bacterium]
MSLLLRIETNAENDLSEIGNYFDEISDTLSQKFYTQFWKTAQKLTKFPDLGERRDYSNPEYTNIRIWQVDGFPNHLIFYRLKDDMLQILRVLHGARDYETIFNEE